MSLFTPRTWFFGVFLVAGLANATTMVAMDLPALARGADSIVRGKVLEVVSKRSGDGRRIFTEVAVEVSEHFKGAPSQQVLVIQPGGVVGDIGQRVDGTATFKSGEEVFLFLEQRGEGRYVVSGMAQGKYRIERSSDGKAAFALPDDAGHSRLLDPVTGLPLAQKVAPLKLEELVAQVRAALSGVAPVQPGPTKLPGKTAP